MLQLAHTRLRGPEVGQFLGVFLRERGQSLDRRRIFARHRAESEQPRLAALEFTRIEVAGRERRLDGPSGDLERLHRLVQSLDAGLDQLRRLRQPALQPARDRGEHRQDRRIARETLVRVADVGGDFFALHHPLTALGERIFLARLDREAGQFLSGVTREIGRRFHLRDFRALPRQVRFDRPKRGERRPRRLGQRPQPAIGVDQRTVGRGIQQRAFVVLAVNLDQIARERAQGLGADALIVDESAGAAVRELHAPEDQFALPGDRLRLQSLQRGMAGGQLEHRGDLALSLPVPDQGAVAARAQRERQCVEQDRFARAGLAGQDRQPAGEFEIQLIDQHDVADRKPGEHGSGSAFVRTERRYGRAWKSRIPDVPAARGRRSSAGRRRPCTIGRRGSCVRAQPPPSAPRR